MTNVEAMQTEGAPSQHNEATADWIAATSVLDFSYPGPKRHSVGRRITHLLGDRLAVRVRSQ